MKTQEVIERLEKELDTVINDDTLFFYDKEGIVSPERIEHGKIWVREYSEKDIVKLGKIIRLSRLNIDLPIILQLFSKNNKEARENIFKQFDYNIRSMQLLKETL